MMRTEMAAARRARAAVTTVAVAGLVAYIVVVGIAMAVAVRRMHHVRGRVGAIRVATEHRSRRPNAVQWHDGKREPQHESTEPGLHGSQCNQFSGITAIKGEGTNQSRGSMRRSFSVALDTGRVARTFGGPEQRLNAGLRVVEADYGFTFLKAYIGLSHTAYLRQ
jgi:hypothetical protein